MIKQQLFSSIFYSYLLLSISVAGCAFSKDPNQEKSPVVIQEKSLEAKYSPAQSNLIIATKSNNLQMAREAISTFTSADFNFDLFEETPAGIAIRYNLPEIMSLLLEMNVDTKSLGSEKIQIEKSTFKVNLKEALVARRHRSSETIPNKLNDAEKIWEKNNLAQIALMMKQIVENNSASALAIFHSSKLSCEYAQVRLIMLSQTGNIPDFKGIKDFLKENPCLIDTTYINDLYTLELVRQFQQMFTNPEILSFLFQHSGLTSSLWNMSDSGIWISPALLIRIAFSKANLDIADDQEFDPCQINQALMHPLCGESTKFTGSKSENFEFLTSLGAPQEKFELIDSRPGKIKYSYVFFQTKELHFGGIEPFFQSVSKYMKDGGPADFDTLYSNSESPAIADPEDEKSDF